MINKENTNKVPTTDELIEKYHRLTPENQFLFREKVKELLSEQMESDGSGDEL